MYTDESGALRHGENETDISAGSAPAEVGGHLRGELLYLISRGGRTLIKRPEINNVESRVRSRVASPPLPSPPWRIPPRSLVPMCQLSNPLAAKRRRERERERALKKKIDILFIAQYRQVSTCLRLSRCSYLNPFCSHINAEGEFHEPHKYRLQNRWCLRGRLYVSTWRLQDTREWKDRMIYGTVVIIILVRIITGTCRFAKLIQTTAASLLLHCLCAIHARGRSTNAPAKGYRASRVAQERFNRRSRNDLSSFSIPLGTPREWENVR